MASRRQMTRFERELHVSRLVLHNLEGLSTEQKLRVLQRVTEGVADGADTDPFGELASDPPTAEERTLPLPGVESK